MKPHPNAFFVLSVLAILAFVAITILVVSESFLVRLDHSLARDCYHHAAERPQVQHFFNNVTDLGWGRFLNWIGGLTVLVVLIRRQWFRGVLWAIGLYSSHYLVPILKDQFKRARPEFANIDGLSYPSGHAMGAAAIYTLLGLLVLSVWHGSRWRWLFAGIVWGLIPLVALSRMMLGVHYFSDVLAGMCVGLSWAFLLAAAGDFWERRSIPQASATTPQ